MKRTFRLSLVAAIMAVIGFATSLAQYPQDLPMQDIGGRVAPGDIRILFKDTVYALNGTYMIGGTLIVEPGTFVIFRNGGRLIDSTGGRIIADGFAKATYNQAPNGYNPAALFGSASNPALAGAGHQGGNGGDGFSGYADLDYFTFTLNGTNFPYGTTAASQVQTVRDLTINSSKYDDMQHVVLNKTTRRVRDYKAGVTVLGVDEVLITFEQAIMFYAARLNIDPTFDINLNLNPWARLSGKSVNIGAGTTKAANRISFQGAPQTSFSREWGHIVVLPGARAAFFRNAEFKNFRKDTTVDRLPYYHANSFPGSTAGEIAAINNSMRLAANGGGGAITSFSTRTWIIDCQFSNNMARYRGGAIQFLETPAGYPTAYGTKQDLLGGVGAYPANKNPNITNPDGTSSEVNIRDFGGGPINAVPMLDNIDSPGAEVDELERRAWDDGRLSVFLGRVRNLRFENNLVRLARYGNKVVGGITIPMDLIEDGDPAAQYPQQYGNGAFGGAVYMAGRNDDDATRVEIGLGVNNSLLIDGNVTSLYPNGNPVGTMDLLHAIGNEARNFQSSLSTQGSRGGAFYVGRYTSLITGGEFTNNLATTKFLEDPTTGSNAGLFAFGGAIYSENTLGRLQLRGGPTRDAAGNPTYFANNRAGSGGAVYVDGNTSTLPSPIIGGSDNTIDTRDYGFNILFENNSAISYGGAIFTKRQTQMNGAGGVEANTLLGYGGKYPVRVWNNTAGYSGGGMHVAIPNATQVDDASRACQLIRASFRDNVVGENITGLNRIDVRGGGAIYSLSADMNVVKGVEFIGNKSYNGNGGAIALIHPQTSNNRYFLSDVDEVTYTGNVATSFESNNDAFTYDNTITYPADARMLTRFIQNEVITSDDEFRASQSGNGITQIGQGTAKTIELLHDGHWVDANTGYVVGYNGTILKISNGGSEWSYQMSGTTKRLLTTHFTNASTGFAAGEDGTLVMTNNGGANWATVTLPADASSFPAPTTQRVNDIFFVSANTGFMVTNSGNFLKTVDGGMNWTLTTIETRNLNAVYFVNSNVGYIAGDGGIIMKTTDGGNNWSTFVIPNFNDNVFSLYFVTANQGVAVAAGGKIVRTTDGGDTWDYAQSGTTNELRSVKFVNNTDGYAVGRFGTGVKTIDGGSNWTTMTTSVPNANGLYGVSFPTGNTGYAVGDFGTIIKTTDAGANWTNIAPADQQLVDVKRYHKEIFLAENGIGLGGAIYLLDSVTTNRTSRTDSLNFNRVRVQSNKSFSGAAVYSDNYDLKLIFNRSLITGNEATSQIGASQNLIFGPMNHDNNGNVAYNAASSDLAGAIIYGEIQGPLPSNMFSEAANSIFDNKGRFLIRLPDAPNTKGVLAGTTGIGFGGTDTLRGNFWGHTEANVTMEIGNLIFGTTTMETFFVAGDGENHLPFLTTPTSDRRTQGPFESIERISYLPVPLENGADENTPGANSIPEKLLQSGRVYDLYDKGTDIKTVDYSKRRMSPIEDFAVGIPPIVKRFSDVTKPSNGKYVKRLIRDPFVAEAVDADGNLVYPFIAALQEEYNSHLDGTFYHPIGQPLYLEANVDYDGLAERSNHDPLTRNQSVFLVINETTGDFIRVNMNQVGEDAPYREVFRTRVELVPDSTNRNPNTLIRRTLEGMLNLGTGSNLLAEIYKNPYNEDRSVLTGRRYSGAHTNFANANNLFSNRPNMPTSNNVGTPSTNIVNFWAGERYTSLPVNVGDQVRVVSRTILWKEGVVPAFTDGILFNIERSTEVPRWTGNAVSLQTDTIVKLVPSEIPARKALGLLDTIRMVEMLNKVFITEDRTYPVPAGTYSNTDEPEIGLGVEANGRDSIFTVTAIDVNKFHDPRALVEADKYTELAYTWSAPNTGVRNWLIVDQINAGNTSEQNPRDNAKGYLMFRGKATNPYVVPGGERVNVTASNFPPHFRTLDNLKRQGILSADSISKFIELFRDYYHAQKYEDANARYFQQDTIFIGDNFTNNYAFDIFVIDSVPNFIDWGSPKETITRNAYDGTLIDTLVEYEGSVNKCGFARKANPNDPDKLVANLTDKLRFQIDINTDDELEDLWAQKVHNWDFRYGRTSYGFLNLFVNGGDTIVVDTSFTKNPNGTTLPILTQVRPNWMSDNYLHEYDSDTDVDAFGSDFMTSGKLNIRIARNEALQLITGPNSQNGSRRVDTTFTVIVNDGHGGKLVLNYNVLVNVAPEIINQQLPAAKEGTDYSGFEYRPENPWANYELIDSNRMIKVYDPNFNQKHKFTLLKEGYQYTENGWSDANSIPKDPCYPEAGVWDITDLKTTPKWIHVNSESGVLYGTPMVVDAPKTSKVTVLVEDEDGLTTVKSFDIFVEPIPHSPELAAAPEVSCIDLNGTYSEIIKVDDLDLDRDDPNTEEVTLTVVRPSTNFEVVPNVINKNNKDAEIRINSVGGFVATPDQDGKVTFEIIASDGTRRDTLIYRLKMSDATNFICDLKVENSIGAYQDLQWGTANANVSTGDGVDGQLTGKLDSNLCEYELPPVPVLDVFDARWTIPQVNGVNRNIYPSNLTNSLLIYVGSIQAGGETGGSSPNFPIHLKWNKTCIPALDDATKNPSGGTWYIQDAGSNGNVFSVDMRSPDFQRISPGIVVTQNGDDVDIVINNTAVSSFAILYDVFSDVEENTEVVETKIVAVSPNPISDLTTINFDVVKSGYTTLQITDVLGNVVTTLVEDNFTAGTHTIQWNGKDATGFDLGSGTYNVRLTNGTNNSVYPIVIVK